jgi:hypothetical protein
MCAIAEQEMALPVAMARAGDAGAWNTLLERFRMPLYVYIFQWVRQAGVREGMFEVCVWGSSGLCFGAGFA